MCTRLPPLPGLSWGWGWGAGGPWAVERFLSGQEDDPRRFGAPRPAGERRAPLIGVLEGSPTPRAALSFLPFPERPAGTPDVVVGGLPGGSLGEPARSARRAHRGGRHRLGTDEVRLCGIAAGGRRAGDGRPV